MDHTPAVLMLNNEKVRRKSLFRYFTMWRSHPQFTKLIEDSWCKEVRGSLMYQCIQKLKRVKGALMGLNRAEFLNIQTREAEAKAKLEAVQNNFKLTH